MKAIDYTTIFLNLDCKFPNKTEIDTDYLLTSEESRDYLFEMCSDPRFEVNF
jgi:hypothetical protein